MSPQPSKRNQPDSHQAAEQESNKHRKTTVDSFDYYDPDFDVEIQEPEMMQIGQKGANLEGRDAKPVMIVLDLEAQERDPNYKGEKLEEDFTYYFDDGWDTEHEMRPEVYKQYLKNFPEEKRERMFKYYMFACKNKCFYLDYSAAPGECWVYRLELDKNPEIAKLVGRLASFAVDAYNQQFPAEEKRLMLDHVEDVNYAPDDFNDCYYITLVVRRISTGETKTYQARVAYTDFMTEYMEVEIFRPQVPLKELN